MTVSPRRASALLSRHRGHWRELQLIASQSSQASSSNSSHSSGGSIPSAPPGALPPGYVWTPPPPAVHTKKPPVVKQPKPPKPAPAPKPPKPPKPPKTPATHKPPAAHTTPTHPATHAPSPTGRDYYGTKYVDMTNMAAIAAMQKANHTKVIPAGDPRSGMLILADGSYTDTWGVFHPSPAREKADARAAAKAARAAAHGAPHVKTPPPPTELSVSALIGRSSSTPRAHTYPSLHAQRVR